MQKKKKVKLFRLFRSLKQATLPLEKYVKDFFKFELIVYTCVYLTGAELPPKLTCKAHLD